MPHIDFPEEFSAECALALARSIRAGTIFDPQHVRDNANHAWNLIGWGLGIALPAGASAASETAEEKRAAAADLVSAIADGSLAVGNEADVAAVPEALREFLRFALAFLQQWLDSLLR